MLNSPQDMELLDMGLLLVVFGAIPALCMWGTFRVTRRIGRRSLVTAVVLLPTSMLLALGLGRAVYGPWPSGPRPKPHMFPFRSLVDHLELNLIAWFAFVYLATYLAQRHCLAKQGNASPTSLESGTRRR
ncbi:MAG: hypothetical protein OXU20_17905 [Myxococcales bacterium]|nr:hypothetical protein [Myxococcales bacterium]